MARVPVLSDDETFDPFQRAGANIDPVSLTQIGKRVERNFFLHEPPKGEKLLRRNRNGRGIETHEPDGSPRVEDVETVFKRRVDEEVTRKKRRLDFLLAIGPVAGDPAEGKKRFDSLFLKLLID